MAYVRKNHYKPTVENSSQDLHKLIQELLPPPPKNNSGRPHYKGRRNIRTAKVAQKHGQVQILDNSKVISGNTALQTQTSTPYQAGLGQKCRQASQKALPDLQRNFESYLIKAITPKRASSEALRSGSGGVPPSGGQPSLGKRSPYNVLQSQKAALTEFERTEILQYQQVYYHGQNCRKQYNPDGPNGGYDDANGDYVGRMHDHVAYRYELLDLLGEGSFGRVFKALDHMSGRTVAIKVVKNKKRFHRQGLVEVRLLETIRKNDPGDISNCLKLTQSFYFRAHLCIVCEMYGANLYELLVRFNLRGLRVATVRDIVVQMMNALCYIYNLNIIHADIKPENILLVRDGDTRVKLIDFGSGCFKGQTIYTYIQSRYYRAPEVILGLPYGPEIDVWSMGCVFCELLTGNPIFPGNNESDQLGLICQYLGPPPRAMLGRSPRYAEFFSQGGRLKSGHRIASTTVEHHLRSAPTDLVEMIKHMLVWDPVERWTPHQIMQCRFVRSGLGDTELVASLGRGAVGTNDKSGAKWVAGNVSGKFAEGAGEMGFIKSGASKTMVDGQE